MSFKDLPALEETYDNLAKEWLNAVKIKDELRLEEVEVQMKGLDQALALFEL